MIRRLFLDLSVLSLGLLGPAACQRADSGASSAQVARGAADSAGSPGASVVTSAATREDSSAKQLKIARFLGFGCALDKAGLAWCWSAPTNKLSERQGHAIVRRAPELDGALAFEKTSDFGYILRPDAQVYVWGTERHSYLGDVSRPTLMPGLKKVTSLSAFGDLCLALQADAEAWSWSDTVMSPEPGEPGIVESNRPERVARGVQALAPPFNDYYIGQDGMVYRRVAERATPLEGLTGPRSLTACTPLTCAVMDPKRVECWDRYEESKRFKLNAAADIVSLKCAGGALIYALTSDGNVWIYDDPFGPVELRRIPTLEGVAELGLCRGDMGCPHCVKLKSGAVSCWGQTDAHRIGAGRWPQDPQLAPLMKAP